MTADPFGRDEERDAARMAPQDANVVDVDPVDLAADEKPQDGPHHWGLVGGGMGAAKHGERRACALGTLAWATLGWPR